SPVPGAKSARLTEDKDRLGTLCELRGRLRALPVLLEPPGAELARIGVADDSPWCRLDCFAIRKAPFEARFRPRRHSLLTRLVSRHGVALIFPQLFAVLVSVLERVEITDRVKQRVVASFLVVGDLNAMAAGVTDVGTVTAGPAFLAGPVL